MRKPSPVSLSVVELALIAALPPGQVQIDRAANAASKRAAIQLFRSATPGFGQGTNNGSRMANWWRSYTPNTRVLALRGKYARLHFKVQEGDVR